MSKNSKTILLCLLALSLSTMLVAQSDLATVRNSYLSSTYFTSQYAAAAKPISAAHLLSRIDTDGSFIRPNRNGTEKDLTDSISKILYVYEHPDSTAFYHTVAVKEKLYKAVNWWLDHYPNFQWTGSAMAQPTSLGVVLAKLYDDFQADAADPTYGPIIANIKTKAKGFLRFTWSKGASKTNFNNPNLGNNPDEDYDWQRMGNAGYRIFGYTGITVGIDDSTSMDTLSIIMNNQIPLQINKPGQGAICAATYDGTMFQHSAEPGSQFYNLGYGRDWLNDLGRYNGWVKNTRWALTTSQQSLWGNILLDGMQWTQYKGHMPHNLIGRSSGKSGAMTGGLSGLLSTFVGQVDPAVPQRAAADALRIRLSNPAYQIDSSKYLWNSHIILQHSPKYFASIRMLSTRAGGQESDNVAGGVGNKNFFTADGSTMLYRTGSEYDNARVGWNWRCIPGTTAKQKTGTLPIIPWSTGTESNNTIAGGVSDGSATIGVFNLSRTHTYTKTKAWKAYFSFRDALICVGNSITDTDAASGDIYTTINQTERLTDAYYNVNNAGEQSIGLASTLNTNISITSPSWFWQDSIGYIILPRAGTATNAIISAETRSGNWYSLDNTNTNASVSVNIFQLSINHSGYDTSYRYVVVPSVSKTELISFFNDRVLTGGANSLYINENTRTIAVSYGGYTGICFTNAGFTKITGLGYDSLAVSVNNYVAVLIKRKATGLEVHAGDIRNGFYTSTPVTLGINRILKSTTFTPDRAYGPVTLMPSQDSTRISLDLSKTSQLYMGEPVHIDAPYLPQLFEDSIITIADAFVKSFGTTGGVDNKNVNFGYAGYLTAQNGAYEIYLKFDLKTVSANLLNARLRLSTTSGGAATQWQLYKVNNDSWTEGGITWNNRPAEDTLLETIAPPASNGYAYWNMTNQLKNLGGDSILTLKIVGTAGIYTAFSSRQNGVAALSPAIVTTTEGLYADNDNDGFGAGAITRYGKVTNNTDCNDADAAVNTPQVYYRDVDTDGFGDPADSVVVCQATPPSGYVSNKADCDDAHLLYADNDGDGYGTGAPQPCGVLPNTDCDDTKASIHISQVYYRDADGDGYVNPLDSVLDCSYTAPAGYLNNTVPQTLADSINVSADAFVQSGSYANTNYGFNSYMTVSNGEFDYLREAYLKFDMHGKIPSNTVDLKLRVYLQGAVVAGNWKLYRVPDNSWTEGGIKANNKPAHDTLLLSSVSGSKPAGYIMFDMYKALQGMGSDSIISLKLVADPTAEYFSMSFATKQNGTVAFRPMVFTTHLQYSGDPLLTDCDDEDDNVQACDPDLLMRSHPQIRNRIRLTMYPNPVTTTFRADFNTTSPGAVISIMAIDGKKLMNRAIPAGTTSYVGDVSKLAPGIYLISLHNRGRVETVRFIKTK